MCLIIAKNNSTPIPADYIENAVINNPDGFGIVGKTAKGSIQLARTLKMTEALPLIREFEAECAELIAHFRWATHGGVTNENTHPFAITNNTYLVHNGIVAVPIVHKQFSDTWHLADEMRRSLSDINLETVRSFFASRKDLGNSKFAMLGKDLPLTLINKDAGTFQDDIWYSNADSFTASKYFYTADSFEVACEYLASGHYTLADLADLDQTTLVKLCKYMPHEVADLIAMDAYDPYDYEMDED